MHTVYMSQSTQGSTGPYTAMPVAGTGNKSEGKEWMWIWHNPLLKGYETQPRRLTFISYVCVSDPGMVSTYMYSTGNNSAQPAPQGQAVPTTNPAYSSYQPTPTQGYQVCLILNTLFVC